MLLKNADVFLGNEFKKTHIRIEGGIIAEISEAATENSGEEVHDCTDKLIIPGLIDIHTHGCAGWDFSDKSPDIAAMTDFYHKNGITSFCATTMTMPPDELKAVMKNIYRTIGENESIVGIYAEGPFLGSTKKGAHDERFLLSPDAEFFSQLDEISGGNIKVIAIDPDYDDSTEFIKRFSNDKVLSIAHTACDYDTALNAFRSGASNVTHMFNAMNPLLHREPGVAGAFFDVCDNDNEKIFAELIADGIHINPAVIRMMYKICGDNLVLISDSMRAAGLPDGEYSLGGLPVYVKDGRAFGDDNTLAGSTANLLQCVRNVINYGVPAEKAIKSATSNPAALVGAEGKIGEIKKGFDADVLILNSDFTLGKVIFKGVII